MKLQSMIRHCAIIGTLLSMIRASCSFDLNIPTQQQRQPTSSSLWVSSISPSFLDRGTRSLDDELLSFAQMTDDTQRRADFESFVTTQLEGAQKAQKGFKLRDLYFVERVNDGLTRLGQAIQDESWDKYVVSGFQEDSAVLADKQLWACVDMLIQFKLLVKKLEQSPKLAPLGVAAGTRSDPQGSDSKYLKKKGSCGHCKVCSCVNNRNPDLRSADE